MDECRAEPQVEVKLVERTTGVNGHAMMWRPQQFCCCVPTQPGVFVSSLVSFLLAGCLSADVWYGVRRAYATISAAVEALACSGVDDEA